MGGTIGGRRGAIILVPCLFGIADCRLLCKGKADWPEDLEGGRAAASITALPFQISLSACLPRFPVVKVEAIERGENTRATLPALS